MPTNTYWVEKGHGGTDAGTETNPYLTIAQAAAVVAADDQVNVSNAGGDYVENVTITVPGTAGAPIVWVGHGGTPGDTGIATIDPTSAGTCVTGSTESFQVWRNFKFNGASSNGYQDTGADTCTFYNCEFSNNGGHGLVFDNNAVIVNCSFHNNSSNGTNMDTGQQIHNCVFYANSNHGLFCDSGTAVGNLCYGLAATYSNITFNDTAAGANSVVNNTCDGENGATTKGIDINGTTRHMAIINNIVYDHATGIELANDNLGQGVIGWNLLNSNTTDETNVTDSINNQTTAPAFTNEAGDDYTLGASSDAIDNGLTTRGT